MGPAGWYDPPEGPAPLQDKAESNGVLLEDSHS